jgi:hypothetical protein
MGDFINFYLYYRLEEQRCYWGFYRLLFILQIGRTTLLPGILKTFIYITDWKNDVVAGDFKDYM